MVAEEGEPLGVEHHAVEVVAVEDQQPASVGGDVDRLEHQFDPAEIQPDIVAQRLVMIAGDVDDARAAVRLLEDAADDIVVARGPVPALAQLPAVDDVADQIERLALDRVEEVDQHVGVAAGRAEVGVGDPDGAESQPRTFGLG